MSRAVQITDLLRIDREHGGADRPDLIDFSVSINPLGPPECALAAFHGASATIGSYPSPYPHALEEKIAHWIGVDPRCVIAGNGSTQLIYLLARVLRPRSASVVIPTFSEIANALILAGARAEPILARASEGFAIRPDAIEAALPAGAGAVFIGRPNSPTGVMIPYDAALEIASRCGRAGAYCVFDEAFVDFTEARSMAPMAASEPGIVVLRSLTKIFAIPGLRVGFAVGNRELIARLRDAMEPWSVNSVADAVARACLEDAGDFIERTREEIRREREYLATAFEEVARVRAFPSAANFVMIEVSGEDAPGDFGRRLRQRGIAIRNLAGLPGCDPGFYRLAVRRHLDNQRLIDAARTWHSR